MEQVEVYSTGSKAAKIYPIFTAKHTGKLSSDKGTPKRKRPKSECEDSEDELRNRTPSGQYLSPKVGTIAGFFEVSTKKLARICEKDKDLGDKHDNGSQALLRLSDLDKSTVKNSDAIRPDCNAPINTQINTESVNYPTSNDIMTKEGDQMDMEVHVSQSSLQSKLDDHINTMEQAIQNKSDILVEQSETTNSDTGEENPGTMSIAMVVKMFKYIKLELNQKLDEVATRSVIQLNNADNTRVQGMEKALQYQDRTIADLQRELKIVKK